MYESLPRPKVRSDLKNINSNSLPKSDIFDRTLFLSRLTSTVIESASANLFSSSDKYLGMKNLSIIEKNRPYQMLIMNRPRVPLKAIKEKNFKARTDFSIGFQKQDTQYKISKFKRKVNFKIPIHKSLGRKYLFKFNKLKVKTIQQNKFKTKNQKKPKEKSLEIDLNEEAENLDKLEQDAEDEKQLKMLDEIENGADIDDIDLNTNDWINVNPSEITKRYEMLRKYVNQ